MTFKIFSEARKNLNCIWELRLNKDFFICEKIFFYLVFMHKKARKILNIERYIENMFIENS